MYVGDNSSVLLECDIYYYRYTEWHGPYGGGATYSSSSTINQQLPAELRNRLELVPTSNQHIYDLRINAFNASDEGTYTCTSYYTGVDIYVYITGK